MSNVTTSTLQTLDIELGLHDVQVISSADAVAAFFAQLGYNRAGCKFYEMDKVL